MQLEGGGRGEIQARPLGIVRAAFSIAAKDLRVEWRQRSSLLSAITFSVLALTLFFFAWDSTTIASIDIAPGVLWVIFTFAGLLGLHRSFGVEQPTRAIDALLAAPIERESIFLGKVIANLVFLVIVQLITVPAMALLYNIPIASVIVPLAAVVFLAAIGIVTIGTLFSSMAVNTRLAELLLPLLALPFFVPIVISAAQMTAIVLMGRPIGEAAAYLRLLAVYDIVAIVLCTMVYPSLIEQ